jgi:hypothetical protein
MLYVESQAALCLFISCHFMHVWTVITTAVLGLWTAVQSPPCEKICTDTVYAFCQGKKNASQKHISLTVQSIVLSYVLCPKCLLGYSDCYVFWENGKVHMNKDVKYRKVGVFPLLLLFGKKFWQITFLGVIFLLYQRIWNQRKFCVILVPIWKKRKKGGLLFWKTF